MTAEADGSVEKFTAARQRFIDAQLLATSQALLVNPDLDPRHACTSSTSSSTSAPATPPAPASPRRP